MHWHTAMLLFRTWLLISLNHGIFISVNHGSSHLLVGRQKGKSENDSYKKRNHAKFFWKTNIFYPLICTLTCAYQWVRNVRFFWTFAMLYFLITTVMSFDLWVFWKIWHAVFSHNHHYEIWPFTLLSMNYWIHSCFPGFLLIFLFCNEVHL